MVQYYLQSWLTEQKTKGTDNYTAYECVTFTKVVFLSSLSKSDFDKSRDCLNKAIINDPEYADAWIYHGWVNTWAHIFGFTKGERLLQMLFHH